MSTACGRGGVFVKEVAKEMTVEELDLLAHPAHPGAQDQAAPRHDVERREHLGRHHRIAIRHDEDAGAELDPRGDAREVAH